MSLRWQACFENLAAIFSWFVDHVAGMDLNGDAGFNS